MTVLPPPPDHGDPSWPYGGQPPPPPPPPQPPPPAGWGQPYPYPDPGSRPVPSPQPSLPPVPYPAPPRRTRRRRGPLFTLLALVLAMALAAGGWFLWDIGRPAVGDCLTSMDRNLWGGMDTVSCDDPDAAYEVVRSVRSPGRSGAREVCSGYPDGESETKSRSTQTGSRIAWAICAVPMSR